MMTLIERALSAEARMDKEAKEQFLQNIRWEIEQIIGQTRYDLFITPPNFLIITEGLALTAYPDADGEPEFGVIKKCYVCNDLFGFKLDTNHIAALGGAIKREGGCSCGSKEPLKLLDPQNAREEVELWNKKSITKTQERPETEGEN